MKPVLRLFALALGSTTLASAALNTPPISSARILADTKVLSSDEFEGRAPGTPGEEKTVAYLVDQFKKIGLQPGNPDGTYIQNVPLVGISSTPTLSFVRDGVTIPMENINDYIGPSSRITPHVGGKDTDVVFVGYGVVAPEYNWDDYKGVDLHGKTVVMLINDPPVVDPATGQLDPKVFGGKAMTYYGRWTYKYEIAAAKGAAACLNVHETGPASYPFAVVVASNSRENFEISAPDHNAGRVALQGWLTLDAAHRLFQSAGLDFATLKAAAAHRDFRPVTLAAKASFTVDNTLRNVASRNVVGLLPGSDPKLRNEYVIYTAHWDHLGRNPGLPGDQIFNGADDNASGVAQLLEIAQDFIALPPAQRPKRSILFLSVTAEEKGLLGSRFYAQNPLYPLRQTLADLNIDEANYLGRTRDVTVIGLGASTLDDLAATAVHAQGRVLRPDPNPEKGFYYRSDHFEFAKVGVPAFYLKRGQDYIGQPADFGPKFEANFYLHDYHKVSDEVRPDWTCEGGAEDAELLMQIGLAAANGATWPEWKPGNEFKPRRDAMLKQ
jgi:Zn-dependent M28 family amino/carboxypeptidase